MIQDLQRIEYRRGLLNRGKKPAGLPVHVWRGTEIPPAVRTAIDTENLFGLGGHYRDKQAGVFLIAVGEAAHEKHRFQTGMELSGCSVPVEDPRKETVALYKTSGLKVVRNAEQMRRQYRNVVRELADGGTWNTIAGQPTDDSEMALLLARLLADQGRYDHEEAGKACIFWLGPDRIYSHP